MAERGAAPSGERQCGEIGAPWDGGLQGLFFGLRDWRARHPTATLAEIEAELDQQWSRLRAQVLADLAVASAAAELAAGGRPACPACGGPLRDGGPRERTLTTMGNEALRLRRDYATCARCGHGVFPPRR
jgi:hypothetical protein